MALQVWLPLTGDLKNLGLGNITSSSAASGISYTTGKIGQCISASSNVSATLTWPDLSSKLAKGNKYSLACWVKLTNTVTSSWIIKLGSNSCGLWWAASTARWVWNENDNGKRVASTPIADDFGNWHHLVVTIDKTTPSETVLCNYVDGEPSDRPTHTFDTTSLSDPTGSTIQISPYGCMLNDLRIYDHILSTKEIKLLSQGLVAHYPLNDGVGGANIAWNSSLTDNLTSWVKSGTWDFVTKDGFQCCHNTGAFQTTSVIYPKQTFNTTTDGMLPYNNLVITMSADVLFEDVVKGTTNYYLALYPSGQTIDGTWRAPQNIASSNHFTSMPGTTLDPNKLNGKGWTHVWSTFKWGDYAWSNTNYRLQFYARDYTGDVYIKNFKIELGEKATPWIPNQADDMYSKLGFDLEVWGENYMPNSVEMAYGTANPSTGTWRNAGSSTMTKSRVQINDSPIGTCYAFQNVGIQTPNDGSCYGIDSFPMDANCDYTISMYARIVSGTEGYAGFNIYNISSEIGGTYTKVDKGYRVTPLASDGSWTLCTYSVHTNSSTKRNIYIGITTGSTSVTTQMCLVKIEKGSIATPWITNQNDAHPMRINNGIIYDCSGYGHNGSLVGECTTDTDSPRYSCSKHITSDDPNSSSIDSESISYIVVPVALTTPECMSIAWWGYHNPSYNGGKHGILATSSLDVPSDYLATAFNYRDSSYDVNASDLTHIRLSHPIVFGSWHHYVITYDGQTSKSYTDGVQVNNVAFDAKKALHSFNKIFFGYSKAGGVNRRNTGNYSDIRIYATALSAEDVKNLYETTASIDDHNNIYAHELWEA